MTYGTPLVPITPPSISRALSAVSYPDSLNSQEAMQMAYRVQDCGARSRYPYLKKISIAFEGVHQTLDKSLRSIFLFGRLREAWSFVDVGETLAHCPCTHSTTLLQISFVWQPRSSQTSQRSFRGVDTVEYLIHADYVVHNEETGAGTVSASGLFLYCRNLTHNPVDVPH